MAARRLARSLVLTTALFALAAPAVAETEVAGPVKGGWYAYLYGLSCDVQSLAAGPQDVTVTVHRTNGTVVKSVGPTSVAPGTGLSVKPSRFAVGFGGRFTCTASAPGAIASTLSVLSPTGDPWETSEGRGL